MPPEIQIQREIEIEKLRARLRAMTDEQLLRFGKSARYMVSRYANNGKPPQRDFVIQLEEARREWRRRHPRSTNPANTSSWLSNGRIEEARINHVLEHFDGMKLQVDFGHDETALVEFWQVVED